MHKSICIFLLIGLGVSSGWDSLSACYNNSTGEPSIFMPCYSETVGSISNRSELLNFSSNGINFSELQPVESLPSNFSIIDFGIGSFTEYRDFKELIKIGNAYFNSTEYAEALYYYEKASLLTSNNKVALYNKGTALCNLGRYKEGKIVLERAHLIDPNDEKILINMNIAEQKSNPQNKKIVLWVSVRSTPDSAWIFLDGKNKSIMTNGRLSFDGPGEHLFELKNANRECKKIISISPKTNTVKCDLTSCNFEYYWS